MERDLKDAIARMLVVKGKTDTLSFLAEKTGKSNRTIARWIDTGIPDGHSAYLVALACDFGEDDALRIGKRHPLTVKAKKAS